jgi:NAD(P)H-dependent nitrite reductase small subunit
MPSNYFDSEEGFYRICKVSDLLEKKGKRFFANDTEIAVFKVDGEIYAVGNICPHQHSAVIYDGIVEEGYVVCPVHGWKFSLSTGKQPTGYSGLTSYQVVVANDEVYVKVLKKELKW